MNNARKKQIIALALEVYETGRRGNKNRPDKQLYFCGAYVAEQLAEWGAETGTTLASAAIRKDLKVLAKQGWLNAALTATDTMRVLGFTEKGRPPMAYQLSSAMSKKARKL